LAAVPRTKTRCRNQKSRRSVGGGTKIEHAERNLFRLLAPPSAHTIYHHHRTPRARVIND
jgi:hypothetical protein